MTTNYDSLMGLTAGFFLAEIALTVKTCHLLECCVGDISSISIDWR